MSSSSANEWTSPGRWLLASLFPPRSGGGDGGDDGSRRPPKRLRPSSPIASPEKLPSNKTALPPELWSIVMNYLPYPTLLQCAAVSRSMLGETMPLVAELHIDSSFQLHAAVARRYRDVKDVYIYSLIEYEPANDPGGEGGNDDGNDVECTLDEDTAIRAVPFLCHFPRLERVFIGGINPINGKVEGFLPARHSLDDDTALMSNLIRAFAGAFRAGALASSLWVAGLRCPRSSRLTNMFRESSCLVCRTACKSFPLNHVVDFECEGSSGKHHYISKRTWDMFPLIYSLDVCLPREKIESIIKGRPGGEEILFSEAKLLNLLGTGTRYIIVPDDGKPLYVVKYDPLEMDEIDRFIQKSNLDVSELSAEKVSEAIKRSFADDERDPAPPEDQCYLAGSSFYDLTRKGVPIDEASFLRDDEWDGIARPGLYYNWRFN